MDAKSMFEKIIERVSNGRRHRLLYEIIIDHYFKSENGYIVDHHSLDDQMKVSVFTVDENTPILIVDIIESRGDEHDLEIIGKSIGEMTFYPNKITRGLLINDLSWRLYKVQTVNSKIFIEMEQWKTNICSKESLLEIEHLSALISREYV